MRAPLTLIADQKNREHRPSYCRNLHCSSRSPSHSLVRLRHCFARTESHSPLHASSGKCSRLARLQAFQQQLTLCAGLASRGSISISIPAAQQHLRPSSTARSLWQVREIAASAAFSTAAPAALQHSSATASATDIPADFLSSSRSSTSHAIRAAAGTSAYDYCDRPRQHQRTAASASAAPLHQHRHDGVRVQRRSSTSTPRPATRCVAQQRSRVTAQPPRLPAHNVHALSSRIGAHF